MFESIDRPVDHESRRRNAESFALTTFFYASLLGGIAAFLTWRVEPEAVEIVEVPMVFLAEPEPQELPGPPAAPALPAPVAKGEPTADPVTAAPPEPTEPVEPTVLPPEVPPEVAPAGPAPQGSPQGTSEIGAPTTGGSTPNGTGDCRGPGCGGPQVTVHKLQLEARKRVEPEYPEAARALGLGEQRCRAVVFVDEEGIPYEVEISVCPQAFHAATREALLAWRFYPPKMGKMRVKAQMGIAVTYRLQE